MMKNTITNLNHHVNDGFSNTVSKKRNLMYSCMVRFYNIRCSFINSNPFYKYYSTSAERAQKLDFQNPGSIPHLKDSGLSPYWIIGIIDSEGNFSVTQQKTKEGVKISLSFKVTQKEHSKGILLELKNYFGCGNIYIDNKKTNGFKFSVNKIDDIVNIIIPHLDRYPLITSKNLDYLDFKKIALLIKNKKHFDPKVLNEILEIKSNMNSSRTFEERWEYLNNKSIVLNADWVQAFIDGEGSFQFTISETTNRGKPYTALAPTLEIAQSNHDVKVLAAFKDYFGCGYLKPKYDINDLNAVKNSRIVNRYIVNQSSNIIEFFDKYPLYTRKYLDYLDWKKLIELKSKGTHNTPEGLHVMKEIKSNMNKGRAN